MKTVSRLTYNLWSLFYHSLCLCGLIWQVTQISTNFFLFDVNKDITIRMPSEFNYTTGTSLYLCFKMEQIFDQEQFRDLMMMWSKSNDTDKRYFADEWQGGSIWLNTDSFHYWATVGEIFQAVLNESIFNEIRIIEILYDDKICFTSSKTELGPIFFQDKYTRQRNRILDDVTSIFVALGDNYPYFDPESLIEIENIREIKVLYPRSYSYTIIKKEFPYSDKCYEYRLSKIVNQYDATIKCNEELEGNKFPSYDRIISKNDLHVHNLTRDQKYKALDPNCNQQPPDCNRKVHFTSFRMIMQPTNVSHLRSIIWPEKERKDLSFIVVSKPRIDNIDYVTYILGALGSWLGFSFLGINPIPHLLTVVNVNRSNEVEDLSNQSNNSNYILSLSNRVAMNETKLNKLKDELKIDLESKIEQKNQRLTTLINIHDSIIRKLIAEINSSKQNQDV